MVAHEVEKSLAADEIASAEDGMAIATRLALGNEANTVAERAAGAGIGGFVAGAHDHAEFLDAGAGRLLQDDLQGGLRLALLVDQHLERQGALAGIGGGDEGFANFHGGGVRRARQPRRVARSGRAQRCGGRETIRKRPTGPTCG
jgi:hypothetical protein